MSKGAVYPDLEGRVVIVTGGASGIGEAIVRALLRQKARVGFIDIQTKRGHELAAEIGPLAHFAQADVTDIEALREAISSIRETFGPIGVLINNAAHDDRHATETVTPEYFDNRIAINLKHQFFAAQAVLPDMVAGGGGVFVNFASTSWMKGVGGMAIYTASKSAVLGLTRSLARDYGPKNVRVNTLAPGWTLTERQKTHWVTPEAEAKMIDAQCLKRWLMPDEVARVTVFLASEEASACTSQQFVVDGGWT
ncbi:MAG: SDR family oxidoreductase [Alphaproteobacteria bacterium]